MPGNIAVTNSTFVGNGFRAVDISEPITFPVTLVNCTFASNVDCAVYYYETGHYPSTAPVRLLNCLVAYSVGGANIQGGVADGGHNLSTDGSLTNSTSIINADPLLGPLADNGGPTWTMALGAGSPALDQADAASAPATDQRGFSRTADIAPDIGAFEGLDGSVPGIRFTSAQYAAGENAGLVAIQVERTGSLAGAVSVDFSAVPGTATVQDFTPTNATVTFAAGEPIRMVYVAITNDALVESNETVLLTLTNAVGAVLETPDTATLTILDDDQPGYLSSCDEAGLRAAISNQVWVVFSCDATLDLTNTITISGNTIVDSGGHAVTLSGHDAVRLFDVQPGASLTLQGITLTHGFSGGGNGVAGSDGAAAFGGAIRVNQGALTLTDCKIWTNTAAGDAGANGDPNGSGGDAQGGAVFVYRGALYATNTEFVGNLAAGGVGGVNQNSGAVGSGGAAFGGAVYATNSALSLADCQFLFNHTLGGLASYSPLTGDGGVSGAAGGGALCSAQVTAELTGCLFRGNGAGATAPPYTWLGASGGDVRGGAVLNLNGNLFLSGCEFTTNSVNGGAARRYLGLAGAGQGGAIQNEGSLTVNGGTFRGNVAVAGMDGSDGRDGQGGAMYNAGAATLADSMFVGNSTLAGHSYRGGAVYSGPDGFGQGGAIYNASNLVGQRLTLSGNQTVGAPGGVGVPGPYPGTAAFGAAIYNWGTLALTNSTVVSNGAFGGTFSADGPPPPSDSPATAGGDAGGGGIYNASGTLALINCTLADNAAVGGGGFPAGTGRGGGVAGASGITQLRGSIIANSLSGSNGFGSLTDLGYNMSSDASCNFGGAGSQNSIDPVLGPLGDYGGPTPTLPLLAGSPAIDAGDPANYPATDQRGHARPYGSGPDIGAFESSPPFMITGRITGPTLVDEVAVGADTNSGSTTNGVYRLEGLAAGTYAVTPASPDYLFMPTNRMVTVGPDQVGVNFKAYHWNALSLDGVTNGMLDVIFPGTNGATYWIQDSSNLVDWTSMTTNTVGPDNFLELQIPITSDPGWFYRVVKP